jgi:hypothetical protein
MRDVAALVRLSILYAIILGTSPVHAGTILPRPAPAVPPAIAQIGAPLAARRAVATQHAFAFRGHPVHRAAPSPLPLLPGGARHPAAFAPYAIGIPNQ